MASVNDLVDLPKQITAWEAGEGFRKSYGIDAERALVKDLRTLLALCVQQSGALEEAQERIATLEGSLSRSEVDEATGDLDPAADSPLEEAARQDRRARRQAKLARAALQEHVLQAYSQGVSKSTLSEVSGLTRQTVDRVLGQWKRRPPKGRFNDSAGSETPLTLI